MYVEVTWSLKIQSLQFYNILPEGDHYRQRHAGAPTSDAPRSFWCYSGTALQQGFVCAACIGHLSSLCGLEPTSAPKMFSHHELRLARNGSYLITEPLRTAQHPRVPVRYVKGVTAMLETFQVLISKCSNVWSRQRGFSA